MAEMAESRWKDQTVRRHLEIRRKELLVDSKAVWGTSWVGAEGAFGEAVWVHSG